MNDEPLSLSTSSLDARASVSHLLSHASTYPCSAATPAFTRLAHSTSTFQLALDALLPVIDPPVPAELTSRILASFILFALYAPHPIEINPFKSVLFVTFVKERDKARAASAGGVAPNEPLVWVLWKILKGDGDDIGPYSPSALARSLLPPNFRATKLVLDDTLYRADAADLDGTAGAALEENARPVTPQNDNARLVNPEEDAQNELVAHAMRLLLAARSRVLSLAEQRYLTPLLPALLSSTTHSRNPPRALLAPADLAPLVATNPALAAGVIGALLAVGPPTDGQNGADLIAAGVLNGSESSGEHTPGMKASAILSVLVRLPPMLPTFDVLGRLLRDTRAVATADDENLKFGDDINGIGANGNGIPTIADLIRKEVLGRFVAASIDWIDNAEREEREGRVSEDTWAQGVVHLCRFYAALLRAGFADPTNDADSAAMAHFSLRHARFGEANALYRLLVGGANE
ncbi:hypothetical protein MSAN_00388900 [Mycena sanguinolenta]|uniref:CCR4-NOT transcription complex subunit 11 n=1 Tax=Mycena sanguinolenta TaxID=230812 RepID=A0A8H7DJW3_9AGAR|nr:hypothetical protein MSAN_00388900 [Mycena sanguinolenta]